MQDSQLHTFDKGMNKDADPSKVASNQMTDAENLEMVSDENGGLLSVVPIASSQTILTIPDVTPQNQVTRIVCNFGTSTAYSLLFNVDYFGSPLPLSVSVTTNTFAAFSAAVIAQLGVYGYTATVTRPDAVDYPNVVLIDLVDGTSTPVSFSLTFSIDGTGQVVNTIQDAFSDTYEVQPLATSDVQGYLFMLSSIIDGSLNHIGTEVGVIKNAAGTRTYTRLLRTNKLFLTRTVPIDFNVSSIGADKYALNYCYKNEIPRVLYVPVTLTTDCAVAYIGETVKGDGVMNLESIGQQSRVQLINNIGRIKFSDQIQVGGSLPSGGYRYFVRFGINSTGNVTEWSLGSGLVPTYKSQNDKTNSWVLIQGDPSGTNTSKANTLLIEGVQPSVFDFVEVAAVQYSGTSGSDITATTAYVVGRQNVTESSVTFTHYGNEQTETLDVGSLLQVENTILSASSQEIKKNRLNFSDIEIGATDDTYQEFIDGITVSTNRFDVGNQGRILGVSNNQLAAVASRDFSSSPTPPYVFSETFDPYNAFNTTTGLFTAPSAGRYQVNFSALFVGRVYDYAFAINSSTSATPIFYKVSESIQTENFLLSSSVSVDLPLGGSLLVSFDMIERPLSGVSDINSATVTFNIIRVDIDDFSNTEPNGYQLPENCANKVGYMYQETYPLYAALHLKNGYVTSPYFLGYHLMNYNYSATAGSPLYEDYAGNVYNYNFVLSSLDIGSIRDSVVGISIWRGDAPPSVIATGLCCLADGSDATYISYGYFPTRSPLLGQPRHYYTTYPTANASDGVRKFGIMYAPEISQKKSQLQTGSHIVSRGTLTPFYSQYYVSQVKYSEAVEFRSYDMSTGILTTPILDSEFIDFNSFGKTWQYNNTVRRKSNLSSGLTITGTQAEGLALCFQDGVIDAGSATTKADVGAYIVQLFNTNPDNPVIGGNPYSYKLIYTGTFIEITPDTPDTLNNVQVYGGDTYTVKQVQKLAYNTLRYSTSYFYSSFVSYYTQSRINTDLNYNNSASNQESWTLKGFANVLSYLQYANNVEQEQWNNDPAYWAENKINYNDPYDPNIPQNGKFPSRIIYSEQRTENGIYDFYRKFLPLSFKDLDAKYGRIVELKDVKDVMVAWQEDAVSSLPYETNIVLSNGSSEAYLGTGGVYAQQPNVVSTFGAKFKSCVVVGRNNSGNNIAYWYDSTRRTFNRYSWDGVKVLSDENGMRSYFLSSLFDAVQNEYDIVMGYSPIKNSIYMTLAGEETVIWNEKFNCFSSRASFIPTRYFTLDTMVVCPNIQSPYGEVFDMFPINPSGYLEWFGVAQIGQFIFEFSTNKGTFVDKRFLATSIITDNTFDVTFAPNVEVTAGGQTSTILNTEFDLRNTYLVGAVRDDNQDRPIISTFAKFRTVFSDYCKVNGVINRFRTKYPNPTNFR